MWYEPSKYQKEIKDVNKELLELKGELTDKEARISLAKFLKRNIGFTTYLLTGIRLAPYQIITIKGLMARNYSLCVWGRGVGKTFCAAIYCILQTIFEPDTHILIAGPTFRTARFIFNHIEILSERPEAKMLLEAMGTKVRRNDEFRWHVNGGSIVAIPLNGEKIRGFRANVLVIDEFLLMSEEIVEKVLIPFLVAPQNIGERLKVRAKEDQLIRRGLMAEEDRIQFPNNAKLIALSSASYTCEYLYRKYDEYIKQIYLQSSEKGEGTYFVSQMAWNSIPIEMVDKNIIKLAQSNEANTANFNREYGAQFLDGSDSYFSMKKMLECSIKDGESPTLLLQGDKDKKYVLAIDPNLSSSETADHFAMCILELDETDKSGTIVHSYAEAGKDLKDRIKYFYYLLKNFNIEMIIIDYAGYQFIEAANEHELFKKDNINIKLFEFEPEKTGEELVEQLKNARRTYNKQHQCIAFAQYFSTDFIRNANEWLQGCIDYKRIWFGGIINGNINAFEKASSAGLDFNLLTGLINPEDGTLDFINEQEALIKQTRYQCASIEVKVNIKGTQTFDLPQIMRRDTSSSRMRRDSYTALLLVAWGMKAYYDITNLPEEQHETFQPFFAN